MPATIGSAVGAALFTAGASVTAVNAAIAATTFVVGNAALVASIGYSAYQQSQAGKARGRQPSNEPNVTHRLIRQADAPQRLILGTATTSGVLVYAKGEPPNQWYLIELASHKTYGLVSVFINNTDIRIGADGFATSTPFANGDDKYIEVSFRNGDIDQAIDPILARDFPDLPATFRQRGKTLVCIKSNYGFGGNYEAQRTDHERVYGSGGFNPLFRVRGAKVFDPRDPAQIIDDVSTYKWSDNAALCAAHYLRYQWPDMRLLPDDRIDFDRLGDAANICDRWETTKSGETFRRHTVNAVIESTETPFSVMANLATAFDGGFIKDGKKFYPMPQDTRKPVATLHEGMLLGGLEYQAQAEIGQASNIIKSRFIAPDRAFKKVEGPVLRDPALIAADGRANEAEIDGAYVERHERIQRLAHRVMKRGRLGKALGAGATLEASDWKPFDVIRVAFSSPRLREMNGLYELTNRARNDALNGYRLALREYSDSAHFFDPANDEQDFPIDPETLAA